MSLDPNKTPEQALAALFDKERGMSSSSRAQAVAWIHHGAKNCPTGVSNFGIVNKELLEQHDYEVSQDRTGRIHITVKDYVDYNWPREGGELNLHTREGHEKSMAHMRDAQRKEMRSRFSSEPEPNQMSL